VYGDVNGDGEVDSTDLTILKRFVLRKIKQISVSEEAVDLNGDNEINSTDVTLLKRYLLRKIRRFPVEG
jgi:hypothetical protein